jgi:hypothetical protein
MDSDARRLVPGQIPAERATLAVTFQRAENHRLNDHIGIAAVELHALR